MLYVLNLYYVQSQTSFTSFEYIPSVKSAIVVIYEINRSTICYKTFSCILLWSSRFWLKYNLGQILKYYASQIERDRGSNSWSPDHDSMCISCQRDICSNSAISDFKRNVLPHYLWGDFKCMGSQIWLMHWQLIFLVQVWLRTDVLCTPSSTWPGFEFMTSGSWQYISCRWDACSNHSAISDFYSHACTIICLICQHTARCY